MNIHHGMNLQAQAKIRQATALAHTRTNRCARRRKGLTFYLVPALVIQVLAHMPCLLGWVVSQSLRATTDRPGPCQVHGGIPCQREALNKSSKSRTSHFLPLESRSCRIIQVRQNVASAGEREIKPPGCRDAWSRVTEWTIYPSSSSVLTYRQSRWSIVLVSSSACSDRLH